MNYNKIEELRNLHKLTKRELYKRLEMSPQGYEDMVNDQTMKVKTLEKLSEIFAVPICAFFNGTHEKDQENLILEDREIYYRRQIDRKDNQIDFLQEQLTKCQEKNEK